MGLYKVNPDGWAPKGLKEGDRVVTGGGVYEITKVRPDGSYQSVLVGTATPDTYKAAMTSRRKLWIRKAGKKMEGRRGYIRLIQTAGRRKG